MSRVEIRRVGDPAARDAARAFGWASFDDTRARFPDLANSIDQYIRDHAVAAELDAFEAHFEPPAGYCFVAWRDDAAVGNVTLPPHGDDGGELNRMYVRDAVRGTGCGMALGQAVTDRAGALGYRYLYLNTLRRMTGAQSLYRKAGYRFIDSAGGYRPGDSETVHVRLDIGGTSAA